MNSTNDLFMDGNLQINNQANELILESSTEVLFDLEKLRLSPDFSTQVTVKKTLVTVPVRKPKKQEFFMVCSDKNFQFQTTVLELEEDNETYIVDPTLLPQMPGEIIPKVLFLAINRQGVLFLWAIKLPGEDGKLDNWNRSAFEAAQMAQKSWVKMVSNRSLGAYEVYEAIAEIPKPEWSDLDFKEILKIAFRNRFIGSLDHPVIKRLRGES